MPSGGSGMLLGGFLTKRFALTIPGTLRFCAMAGAGAVLLTLGILISCDDVKFAGVNHFEGNISDSK